MFSMCSELTPRAHIPDTRIPQLMQPCPFLARILNSIDHLALFSCRLVSRPIFGPQEQGQQITGEIKILTPYIIDLFCGLRNSIFHLRLVDKVTLQLQSPTTREVFLYIKCEPIPCPFTVFFFCQEGRLPFTCNLVSICRVVSYSSKR